MICLSAAVFPHSPLVILAPMCPKSKIEPLRNVPPGSYQRDGQQRQIREGSSGFSRQVETHDRSVLIVSINEHFNVISFINDLQDVWFTCGCQSTVYRG